jgi:thiol-disulfide isomerase/thioredoxin
MKFLPSFIFLIFSFFSLQLTGQKFSVNIETKNYTNDTIIIGNYFGERTLVRDTIYTKGNGKFLWKSDSIPSPGMYLAVLKPDNIFVQFIVNEKDTKFSMEIDAKNTSDVKIKGSNENEVFYNYLRFLSGKRTLADTLRAHIEKAKKAGTTDAESQKQLENLDKEVKLYQADIIKKNPGTFMALLIKSNTEIEIPEFKGSEDTVRYLRYYYYKDHYFDNIDSRHPALIRTPFLHQKIDYYVSKLVNQQPDSLIFTVDKVLKWLEPNQEAYRYYLAEFLNRFAQMKMVGQDAIYVHLVDNYYAKGKAPWITEENFEKMKENANDLRPVLIGKTMPDITTYLENNVPVRLLDIKSPYLVVIFWAPDCGHCNKTMPDVVSFYKKNRDKGLKLLSICTKGGDKLNTCWPAIKEKGMEDFINTADEYSRYNMKVRIKSTPKIFILDEKKEIIIKDIGAEELDRIFNEILAFEEKKRMQKQ